MVILDVGDVERVGHHSSVSSGVEGAAGVGSVLLDGQEDNRAQGRDEKTNATNSVCTLHVVDDAPTSSRDVMVIISKGDHRRSGC